MKAIALFSVITLSLFANSQGGGLPLSLPLGGGGGPPGQAVLGPNPYRGFPVNRLSTSQTYNSQTNRYAVKNRYFAQGQTRDADVIGLNLAALPRVIEGLTRRRR